MATNNSTPETATRQIGKMALTVPSDREVVLRRVFDAPRRLVWEAFTKPEHVTYWYGGTMGSTMPVCEIDLRPATPSSPSAASSARSSRPSGWSARSYSKACRAPGCIETVTFEEQDGKTTLTVTASFDSIEARDGMLQSGMETGAAESYDRLEEILRTMA